MFRRPLRIAVITLAASLIALNYWFYTREVRTAREHRGQTMGSTFSVTWVETEPHPDLPRRVDELLSRLTHLTSTYEEQSQVSQFNRAQVTSWVNVDADVATVVAIAQSTSELSDGAFDITVKPLVALWGFGPDAENHVPTAAALDAAAASVGFRRLEVRQSPPSLKKNVPELEIDLNGIVPGFAADKIAELFERAGVRDYLIDVGGELRAAGAKDSGEVWTLAIETPDSAERAADSVYELTDVALATSGDYRNYYERDGKRLSHTIDPRTRRPIEHHLASVTVLAPTAAQADALATALNVLGPDAGLELARKHSLSVLMLVRAAPGTFERRASGYFAER